MKLRWTHRARRDLVDIGRYIARDKPEAARRWVERLRRRAQTAAERPSAGRKVPEIDRSDVRELLVRKYRIVYQIHSSEIRVLTVFEGYRLLSKDVEAELD